LSGSARCPITRESTPNGTMIANSQGQLATDSTAPPTVGASDAAEAAITVLKLSPRPSLESG